MGSGRLARNSAWMALELAVDIVGSALLGIVVARTLGPTIMGDYSYVMWLSTLAASVAMSGVTQATGKYAAEYVGRGDASVARGVVRKSVRWQVALGATVCLGLIAVTALQLPPASMRWAALAIASMFPAMLVGVWARGIDATQRFERNTLPSMVANASTITLGFMAMALGWGLVGLAAAMLVGRTTDALLRRRSFLRSYAGVTTAALPADLSQRFRSFAWRTSLMLAPSMVLWDRSEVFFLRRYSDLAEVAFYSISFGLSKQVLMVLQPFLWPVGTSMLVEYGRGLEGTTRMARTALRYCLMIGLPLAWGLSAVGSAAVVLVYGPRYAPAAQVLALVALFAVAQPLVVPVRQLLLAAEKQNALSYWAFAAAVPNVALDLLLIPRYGATGAALANGIAQTLALLSLLLYAHRAVGLKLSLADVGRPVLSALAMVVVAYAVSRSGPPIVAVPAAIVAGAVVYGLLLRLTRALDSRDRVRLLEAGRILPGPAATAFAVVVRLLTPRDDAPRELARPGD